MCSTEAEVVDDGVGRQLRIGLVGRRTPSISGSNTWYRTRLIDIKSDVAFITVNDYLI